MAALHGELALHFPHGGLEAKYRSVGSYAHPMELRGSASGDLLCAELTQLGFKVDELLL